MEPQGELVRVKRLEAAIVTIQAVLFTILRGAATSGISEYDAAIVSAVNDSILSILESFGIELAGVDQLDAIADTIMEVAGYGKDE